MHATKQAAPRHGERTPPRCKTSLEREAWDGDWYRRGWFDDGTPLGSATSEECRIDSIAQVLGGDLRAPRTASVPPAPWRRSSAN